MKMIILSTSIGLLLSVACSEKSGGAGGTSAGGTGAGGTGAGGKASVEQCQKAYEHMADLKVAKDSSMSREQVLELARGNISSCPKMVSRAGLDCMMAMTAYDMMAWGDCVATK